MALDNLPPIDREIVHCSGWEAIEVPQADLPDGYTIVDSRQLPDEEKDVLINLNDAIPDHDFLGMGHMQEGGHGWTVLVLKNNADQIVGLAYGHPSLQPGWYVLKGLIVVPDEQRKGFGSMLLGRLIRQVNRETYPNGLLGTTRESNTVRTLLVSLGLTRVVLREE